MKLYTKTGDKGTTGLIGGTRISKAALRIDAYGTVDELNAYIGLIADFQINAIHTSLLRTIQDRLFTIGSHLALAPHKSAEQLPDILPADLQELEHAIDRLTATVPPLRSFILPGGHIEVSYAHIARTVCRRAERDVVRLANEEEVAEIIIQYLNRLSDFLFILSRAMAQSLQVEEIAWKPRPQ